MESLGRDIQFSLRTFAKNPGFTTVAVLSLAQGRGEGNQTGQRSPRQHISQNCHS
jgi:hypothetical protein